jgi:putative ABC transport system permease protein
LEHLFKDVRYGLRSLAKTPGFTAVALAALGLGIGANTAIFTVVNAALLRPLEYPDSDRLVMIWQRNPSLQIGIDLLPSTAGNWERWRKRNHVFDDVAAFASRDVNLTGAGAAERFGAARVTASFFPVMGVKPHLGRTFLPGEDRAGAGNAVILSHRLWRQRFGSDPGILDRAITLNGQSYSVVGIMPAGFGFPKGAETPAYFQFGSQTDLWVPVALTQREIDNFSLAFAVVARRKAGVPVRQAQAEMDVIMRRLEKEDPSNNKGFSARVIPLQENIVSAVRPALLAMMAAVAAVLLIACANLANLLLARAASRQKEVAIRAALGATRTQLARQFLTESMLLSFGGGCLGLALAYWGMMLLGATMPANVPRMNEARMDLAVVAFTFGISVLTGSAFGLAPAVQASCRDLNARLKEGGRTSGGHPHSGFRNFLVVAEVAIALVLLAAAGLLLKSFLKLHSVDPGFRPENVVALELTLPMASGAYTEAGRRAAFFGGLVERAAALPGVASAGAISHLPLGGGESIEGLSFEGRPAPPPTRPPLADRRVATPEYFRTMGIPLLRGRGFTGQDRAGQPPVAIIDETMARRHWPGEDPLGKRFRNLSPKDPWITVAGIVRSVRHSDLAVESRPTYFLAHSQFESSHMTLVVRAASDPALLVAALRKQIWEMDKDQPVSKVTTLENLLSEAVAAPRFRSTLIGVFAALALALASIGIYGVMSHSVSQRTHEIGIRVALGAGARQVLGLVLARGMLLTGVGVASGLAAALGLTRLLSGLLYGVEPADPGTFTLVSILLAGVALLACYVPARRAMQVDPLTALRHE